MQLYNLTNSSRASNKLQCVNARTNEIFVLVVNLMPEN